MNTKYEIGQVWANRAGQMFEIVDIRHRATIYPLICTLLPEKVIAYVFPLNMEESPYGYEKTLYRQVINEEFLVVTI